MGTWSHPGSFVHSTRNHCPFSSPGWGLGLGTCVCSLSRVWLFETPWTVARQAPLSMGFSRQELWNGLPCLPPRDLPDLGMLLEFPALVGGFFIIAPPRKLTLGHVRCNGEPVKEALLQLVPCLVRRASSGNAVGPQKCVRRMRMATFRLEFIENPWWFRW